VQIAIDAIDLPATLLRKRLQPDAVAAMAASLASDAGQTTPIVVIANGNRFQLIDGRHRIEAARSLGWNEIWAEKAPHFAESYATAAGAASNAVRAPLEPLDLWRAMVALQAGGRTLSDAAAVLGIDDRRARMLDKLGRMHPDVIAMMESRGVPGERDLATIAMAPQKVQASAVRVKKGVEPAWWNVAAACRDAMQARMSRSEAIFDADGAGLAWELDPFAQPGSREQWTTTDTKGFLAAQRAALETELENRVKRKQAVALVECDPRSREPKAPAGWTVVYFGDPEKPARGMMVLLTIMPDGTVRRRVAINPKADKERELKAAERKAAKAAPAEPEGDDPDDGGESAEEDAGEDGDDAPPAAPVADISPLTKAGRDLVAAAKTAALKAQLRELGEEPIAWRNLCVALVLTLHARNVEVRGYNQEPGQGYAPGIRSAEDLVRQLVTPAGHLDLPEDIELAAVVRETLARCLSIDTPSQAGNTYHTGSGLVAEWIGHAIGASAKLPRMDTAEILAAANGDTLRSAATAAGIKPSGKIAELRRQLEGNAETWRPPGAEFGAPGPKPLPAPRRPPATEMEDAA